MLRTNSTKKAFTCFYWVNGGCKHSADQCKFVHEYTDRVAKPPKPPRYGEETKGTPSLPSYSSPRPAACLRSFSHCLLASAWREDRPETKNLIDLLSAGSETSDSKVLLTAHPVMFTPFPCKQMVEMKAFLHHGGNHSFRHI